MRDHKFQSFDFEIGLRTVADEKNSPNFLAKN
jgi:hypothetical protein